jgi:methionyl-tRNA formyltransferase
MKLIFCGTPGFALPTLENLLRQPFEIELVVTNPDEASGRGYGVKAPPVKRAALGAGLTVFQPQKLQHPFTRAFITAYRPDALVVVAYGHLIPGWMIELPRFGCINLHASLLPKYRGAAPIPWAIIRGERVTGVTTMRIDAGLDTGEILLQRAIEIRDDDTAESLADRLSTVGADLMVETLDLLGRGKLQGRPQDPAQATLAPLLKKKDGRIDWRLPAGEIERRVRALQPWPGAFTEFRGRNLHIWKASVAAEPAGAEARGTLVGKDGRLLAVCGNGTALEIVEVQVEGRRRISGRDFLHGIHLQAGEKLDAAS